MNVLGISHDLWISSAALLRDGEILAAVCEERLNRQKKYKGFPSQSIDACLKTAGITLDDIDLVVSGWNPAWHMEALHPRFSGAARWRPEYLYSLPNNLLQKAAQFPVGPVEQRFTGFDAPLVYIDHHVAHAADAFYRSPYECAAVFSADGRGERHTALYAIADREGIHPLDTIDYPHSLGLFYGMITQYLGFVPDSDEWKVMALAAYGSQEDNRFYPVIRNMIETRDDGTFRIDLQMCGFHQPDVNGALLYTKDFVDAIDFPPRKTNDPIDPDHLQLAFAIQRTYEEIMTSCLKGLHERTGLDRVVLSGGCMMNSVYNGKVTSQTPFKEAFVSSSPDDSGISIGAAYWGYHQRIKNGKRVSPRHNYWGPCFDNEIENTLIAYKVPYERLDNPSRTAGHLLAEGKLLGWFQGAMEFGQRALGNRSILADPRNAASKDLVNSAVKYRESFRPFAPAILAERVSDYFYTEGTGQAPYMERVYTFREEVRHSVPAVVHVDGSGRLQTVEHDTNPRFYELIKSFADLTEIPIVLNTSFNLNGEPIVCTPSDAIRTFYSCGLDILILGDFLIRK